MINTLIKFAKMNQFERLNFTIAESFSEQGIKGPVLRAMLGTRKENVYFSEHKNYKCEVILIGAVQIYIYSELINGEYLLDSFQKFNRPCDDLIGSAKKHAYKALFAFEEMNSMLKEMA